MYHSTFKAQTVLELLKETKTLTQLAAEHRVHPNVRRAWRDQALKDFASLFERRDSFADAEAAYHKQQQELDEEVYVADYGSPREAREGIAGYLTFSTTERPHQALRNRRPVERYRG